MLIPRQNVPDLTLPTVSHGDFNLATDLAECFTLITVYRGLHCPICANYLKELDRLTPEFEARGVKTIAISCDDKERAQDMAEKVGASGLRIGYGLSILEAQAWGLAISTSRGKTSLNIEESKQFSEPALFLIKPDQTLYYASVQTMPFVRPAFTELVQALDFMIKNDYPARGEYTNEP